MPSASGQRKTPARTQGAKSAKSATVQADSGLHERETPQSNEAEMATLGAMLMSDDSAKKHGVITKASMLVDPQDFYRPLHQKICWAIYHLFLDEQPVDYVTVAEELRRRGQLEEIGGAEYLSALIYQCPSNANVEAYARVVAEKSLARSMAIEVDKATTEIYSGDNPTAALMTLHKSYDLLDARASRVSRRQQQYTGDEVLDQKLGAIEWLWPGWIPMSEVTLLCARGGTGKSQIAMDICRRIIECVEWPDRQPNTFAHELRADGVFPEFLWIDTENGLAIFRHRLQEWGFPRGHFRFQAGKELEALKIDNDRDFAWMQQAAQDIRPCLIIVDSLSNSHSGDENSNDWMKEVMTRLTVLAKCTPRCALLCIHHLAKIPQGVSDWPMNLDMVRGASAIQQYPRSIIGCGTPNKEDRNNHGFASLKLNVAMSPKAIGYYTTDQGPAWGDVPRAVEAEKPFEAARAFLIRTLKGGIKPSNDVYKECEEQGICSVRTLKSAVSAVGIKSIPPSKSDQRWFMELPTHLQDKSPDDIQS